MKTKAFFFMVCIWLLTTNGFAQNTIKGDGNIITKEISISDYDEISYVGKVNIKYEQSNASPFFKITIDRKSTRLNSSHTDSSRMPSSA